MREEGEILKHQADLALFWRDMSAAVGDHPAINQDLASILPLNARDHA